MNAFVDSQHVAETMMLAMLEDRNSNDNKSCSNIILERRALTYTKTLISKFWEQAAW